MGQAKRRGTYEERKAAAMRRRETDLEALKAKCAMEAAERERVNAEHRRINGHRRGKHAGFVLAAAALAMGGCGHGTDR